MRGRGRRDSAGRGSIQGRYLDRGARPYKHPYIPWALSLSKHANPPLTPIVCPVTSSHPKRNETPVDSPPPDRRTLCYPSPTGRGNTSWISASASPRRSDSWKLAQRAEELGFTHAWFYDTQMITADCFVAMGAAALKTSRIRLGTGVLVPSNRIAAVTANAFATLNGLAPGRIDFGVGTGFSARRAMGLGAMKLADMEEYIRVVYGLLDGETSRPTIEGKRARSASSTPMPA